MRRSEELAKLNEHGSRAWDLAIIGGGATGLGIAMDAVSRGLKTVLFERYDFAKGTSSKSTKLIHGGVRYLAQGNIPLVFEALHERGILAEIAPHLVHDLSFVIPTYGFGQRPFYGIGLKLYDLLAGRHGFEKSCLLSVGDVKGALPNVQTTGLRGGIAYHDGQFDDARLAVNIAQTASEYGACVLNYMGVTDLVKDGLGRICGVSYEDADTGVEGIAHARCVINATGVFVDDILQHDRPQRARMVAASQGSHIVVDRKFMSGTSALMIPKTSDGRVLFAVPWHDRLIIGTTDVPVGQPEIDPRPSQEELAFIINNANAYFANKVSEDDVLSIYAGQRPLAAPKQGDKHATKEISRSHKILVDDSGLVTIIGGKWTTYRRMAEDTLNKAQAILGSIPASRTKQIILHGAKVSGGDLLQENLRVYGSDREGIERLQREDQSLARTIHPRLNITFAQILWAFRYEMACSVEDALARRTRAVFLDAKAAIEASDTIAAIAARELKRDQVWQTRQAADFREFAKKFLI